MTGKFVLLLSFKEILMCNTNSVDPNRTLRSDLGLHCLATSFLDYFLDHCSNENVKQNSLKAPSSSKIDFLSKKGFFLLPFLIN